MAQPPPSARGRRALARMGLEGGNHSRIKDPLPQHVRGTQTRGTMATPDHLSLYPASPV